MIIAKTRQDLDQALCVSRERQNGMLALVPTMGALHAGHLALIAHARTLAGIVVASIFVNPLQFGQSSDLERYPRDELGDVAALERAGCDVAWLPTVAEMYPTDDATLVEVGGPAHGFEGAIRPGHFRGVATVVTKLFGQVRPDFACFGEKDWQQLQVIRRTADDLALNVRIVGVPTLRDPDGLPMSSRNRFLTPDERATAPLLHEALQTVRADLQAGTDSRAALARAWDSLAARGFVVDYLALVDGQTMRPVRQAAPGTRLIVAAQLGSVRLLDNLAAA